MHVRAEANTYSLWVGLLPRSREKSRLLYHSGKARFISGPDNISSMVNLKDVPNLHLTQGLKLME